MRFEDLRLGEPLLHALREAGYQQPTPIQAKAIPPVLDGRDVLGCAQTGTGKTAAFALPLIELLRSKIDPERVQNAGRRARGRRGAPRNNRPRIVRGLVICPTRELALQIRESFKVYGAKAGLRSVALFGGVNQNPQVRSLRSGVDIVIATPGRLLDLIGQGLLDLGSVEVLVLDEADRMLDMGFLPDIRRVLDQLPEQRQSLLFSATMPAPIRELANDMLRDPVPIEVARVSSPNAAVSHQVYSVEKTEKVDVLQRLLEEIPDQRVLVFTRTKHGADKVVRLLTRRGFQAGALHGNKSQAARTRALEAFRSGAAPVLVATDIAARGIDVDGIGRVVNFDITPDPETYVHRIGRTGRAGATGLAISLCSGEERGNLRAIERFMGIEIERILLPGQKAPVRSKSKPRHPFDKGDSRPKRTNPKQRQTGRKKTTRRPAAKPTRRKVRSR